MEIFIQVLKEINLAQILILFAGGWFFYNRLDAKIDKIDAKLDAKIDGVENSLTLRIEKLDAKIDGVENSLSQRIDKLGEKIEDVDRRLCRIEGSLATQGHCLFNQSKKEQKAE
ncbi:MAG: hypothetical protein ABFD00_10465 [Chloroherpetonaceae bacterium]